LKSFYNHLYPATSVGSFSPWDKNFVEKRLDLKKIGHGVKFKPYDESWPSNIIGNINPE